MTFPNHTPDDDIESHRITDLDGDLWASLTYFGPGKTPGHRFDCWVVDFADGQRLTGDVANEVAKRLLNDPGIDGTRTDRFDDQADSILDSVVYDDDSGSWRLTWGGVRVWFEAADDQGDDVVLYQERGKDARAGLLEAPPFEAQDLHGAMKMAQRQVARHE